MPSPLLTFLKYLFLILLYLFFLRVLRAVWMELREPKGAAASLATPELATVGVPRAAAPAPAAARDNLVVVEPEEQAGRSFPVLAETTVGRAPGCAIALSDDTFVSQVHARVFVRDGDVMVEDLGSTNGTWVNRRKVSGPATMRPGDHLQVGRTVLELRR